MKLNEILNKPYPYEKLSQTKTHIEYRAETEDGDIITLWAHLVVPHKIQTPSWSIEFGRKNPHSLHSYQKFDITGDKDAFRIFATVGEILKDFISEKPDMPIVFSAEGDSRKKLYLRFAKMIAARFHRELTTYTHNGADYFFLKAA